MPTQPKTDSTHFLELQRSVPKERDQQIRLMTRTGSPLQARTSGIKLLIMIERLIRLPADITSIQQEVILRRQSLRQPPLRTARTTVGKMVLGIQLWWGVIPDHLALMAHLTKEVMLRNGSIRLQMNPNGQFEVVRIMQVKERRCSVQFAICQFQPKNRLASVSEFQACQLCQLEQHFPQKAESMESGIHS